MSAYSIRLQPVVELSCGKFFKAKFSQRNCSIFNNWFLDVMECDICCLDRVFVCGDKWDCDENLRKIVLMCSLGFIAFFSVLSGTCMYISKVRGNAYRKKFARVIIKKEREIETQKSMVGVSYFGSFQTQKVFGQTNSSLRLFHRLLRNLGF